MVLNRTSKSARLDPIPGGALTEECQSAATRARYGVSYIDRGAPVKRPTISDIARQAGFPGGRLVRAQRQPDVSEATRRRIMAIADEIGFSPSSAARALSGAAAQAIGLALCRLPARSAWSRSSWSSSAGSTGTLSLVLRPTRSSPRPGNRGRPVPPMVGRAAGRRRAGAATCATATCGSRYWSSCAFRRSSSAGPDSGRLPNVCPTTPRRSSKRWSTCTRLGHRRIARSVGCRSLAHPHPDRRIRDGLRPAGPGRGGDGAVRLLR